VGLWETISFVDRSEFLLSGIYVMPVKTPLNACQFKAVSSEVKQAIGKNQCDRTQEAGDNFGEANFTAKGRVRLKWQKVILTCLYLFTLGKLTSDRTQCYLYLISFGDRRIAYLSWD
jgi:hypothetical protein